MSMPYKWSVGDHCFFTNPITKDIRECIILNIEQHNPIDGPVCENAIITIEDIKTKRQEWVFSWQIFL